MVRFRFLRSIYVYSYLTSLTMGPGTNAATTEGKRQVRKDRGEEDGQA
jgi:hypothetical protein